MTDPDEPQHRAYHQSDPSRVTVRDTDDEDGVFAVRMPIASTGDVRNKGDDPLTRDELDGMAQQIEERAVGVFLDHGTNRDISGSRYGATGKVGEWAASELVEGSDGEDLLEADARLMNPETLPDTTGSVREALAALKAQVERGFALSSSIGWREDDSSPGGNDLMEASIVGIGADPRTTSDGASAAMARAVVMGPNTEQQRHLSEQQAEMAESLLGAYRDEQGNGSVSNFEDWLWSVAYYEFDENQFHAAMTALQEFYRDTTPLEEPVDKQFAPFLDGRGDGDGEDDEGGDARDSVTDDTNESGDPDDTNNEEQDDMDAQDYRESMLEMQRQQTETLSTLADAIREDDEDGDDDDDEEEDGDGENDEDGDDEDDDEEQSSDDADEARVLEIDGEEVTVDDVQALREQLQDADPDAAVETQEAEPDDEQSADESTTTETSGQSTDGPDWRA